MGGYFNESRVYHTFANFVNSELVGLILDIFNGWQVEVTRNAAILFIQKLHSLSCYVNHAYCQKYTIFKMVITSVEKLIVCVKFML